MGKPIQFGKQAAKQIAGVVRQVEGDVRGNRALSEDPFRTSPECYFALTPSGGIPARSSATLGSAECTIYEAQPQTFGSTTRVMAAMIDPATGAAWVKRVYNVGSAAVSGSIYVPVWRTKEGTWFADPAQGAESVGICHSGGPANTTLNSSPVQFTLVNSNFGYGSNAGWTVSESDDWFVCVTAGFYSIVHETFVKIYDGKTFLVDLFRSSNGGSTWTNAGTATMCLYAANANIQGHIVLLSWGTYAAGDLLKGEVSCGAKWGSGTDPQMWSARWIVAKM